MSDDKSKKPKIDLKARLGKTAVGVGGAGTSAVPLPVPGSDPGSAPPPGSIPVPSPTATPRPSTSGIAPPPGISPGIPVPPFAPVRSAAPAAPSKPVAAQQTIKVELGEEVQEERKKAKKRTALFVAIGVVVGILFGFVVGTQKASADRGAAAQAGAGKLRDDVKAATDKIKELNEKLQAGAEKLKNKEFPSDLQNQLASINVPFDATTLEGKGVGGLPSKILKPLLQFTIAVEDLNKTKESLKNLIGLAQPRIEKFWKEEKDPVASYSVFFRGETGKMLAELVPNKEPFPLSKDFPDTYTILTPKRTQQGVQTEEKKATRWKKGDLTGSDPIVIPLDTRSTPVLSGEEFLGKLNKAIYDIRVIIEGNSEDVQNPTPGLIKQGEDLEHLLQQAATAR